MEDGTIFQYPIQRCIGNNTTYTIATFSRVVPLRKINNTTKYKIV